MDKYVGKSLDEARTFAKEKADGKVGGTLKEKAKQGTETLKQLLER